MPNTQKWIIHFENLEYKRYYILEIYNYKILNILSFKYFITNSKYQLKSTNIRLQLTIVFRNQSYCIGFTFSKNTCYAQNRRTTMLRCPIFSTTKKSTIRQIKTECKLV